jgi:hypothetical protein
MRSALAAVVAAATVAAAAVGVGCVIITGSTDGYRLQGSGGGDGGAEGGAMASIQCVSSADCGDGGEVCCVVVNSSLTLTGITCQAAPCTGALPAQLCKTSAECGKTGLCTLQSCSFGSTTVTIQACGTVETCTPQ